MRVLVPIKKVIDANAIIKIKDNKDIENKNVKMAINPFCEIALEQAIRLKEESIASEVVAILIGDLSSENVLRSAFAMGADRCILIVVGKNNSELGGQLEPLGIAKVLQKIVTVEKPSLIIFGKQSIDMDNCQSAQMLAALLGVAQLNFASSIEVIKNKIIAQCQTTHAKQIIEAKMPCIISADLQLNKPRYVSLMDVIKAKERTIESATIKQLGINIKNRLEIINIEYPKKRASAIKINSAKQLVELLKNEKMIS